MSKELVGLIGALLIVSAALLGGFSLQAAYGGKHFYSPNYGNLQCFAINGGEEFSVKYDIESGDEIQCPPHDIWSVDESLPGVKSARTVQQCNVKVYKQNLPVGANSGEIKFEKCSRGGGCVSLNEVKWNRGSDGEWATVTIIKGNVNNAEGLDSEEYLKVSYVRNIFGVLFPTETKTKVEVSYKAYILGVEEKGRFEEITNIERGCFTPTSSKVHIVKGDWSSFVMPGKEHSINYVVDWSPILWMDGYGVYYYNNIPVACKGTYAYPIEEEVYEDGHSIWKESGNGFPIPCCPSQPFCNDDFTLKENDSLDKEGDECSIFDQSSYDLTPQGEYMVRYDCRDGIWIVVERIKNKCLNGCGPNEYCDSSTYTCESVGDFNEVEDKTDGSIFDTPIDDILDSLHNNLMWLAIIFLGVIVLILFVKQI